MTCFLDTSALVKLYVPESGHTQVRALMMAPIIAADVALVELPAALHRKKRMGELSHRSASILNRAFTIAAARSAPGIDLHLVATGTRVLQSAARLVARHPLRAYDAVQLATALAASAAIHGCTFGSFDEQLNAAALDEGLTLSF